MIKVTIQAGAASGTSHKCKTFPPVCCSSTHFVHTIKGEKVVKIFNTGLKGRPTSRLKEISAVYKSDHAGKIASDVNIEQNSSSAVPIRRRATKRCQRTCRESDTESGIGSDDYVFTKMTLNDFKNSLCKAKKKRKVSGISAEFYPKCLTEHLDSPARVKEELCELEESLSCYIVKLKKTKSKGRKCLGKIQHSFLTGSREKCIYEKNTREEHVLNGIKSELVETDALSSVFNSDLSAPELACSGQESIECRNAKDLCTFNGIKKEVELDYFGSYGHGCSSPPNSGDANLSAGSTAEIQRGEDRCEDRMQEFTSAAEKGACLLRTGLPETVNEAETTTILQTSLKENFHICVSKACTDYLIPVEHVSNSTNADKSSGRSRKLNSSEVINLKPVFLESKHEKETVLKVDEICSSQESLNLSQSFIDQQICSTEYQSIMCMESKEKSQLSEVEASSDGGRKDFLQGSVCRESNAERSEKDKDILAGVVKDSNSHNDNSSVGESHARNGCFQADSSSLGVSNPFDTSSSSVEISKQTPVLAVYPAELSTSDTTLIGKATESPEHNDDSKLGKRPKRLLSTRKMISPTTQKRLRQAMGAEELKSRHLSRLCHEGTETLTAFTIENKSENSQNGSPPLLKNGVLKTPDSDCSSDAQKAIRFSQRQMHDIDSLASKLLRKLKCMKNIVEEILHSAACPSMPSRYTDEEMRNATESANELEDGARRLLTMMARDCNRFCKIMDSDRKKGNGVCVSPKERRKIMFADEAGGQLCHVKVFEEVHKQRDDDPCKDESGLC